MCQANEGPLDDRAIIELYQVIIHESRRIQTRAEKLAEEGPRVIPKGDQPSVAFQGEPGAFSEEAAIKLLGDKITRFGF